MSRENPRQRIRKESSHFRSKDGSLSFSSEEHSVFFDDGNIASRHDIESPVIKGLTPHQPTDVAGQCQSCLGFVTGEMIAACELCWQIVCRPCASQRNNIIVCPACANYLARRRWVLILRKLFIDPFVERLG